MFEVYTPMFEVYNFEPNITLMLEAADYGPHISLLLHPTFGESLQTEIAKGLILHELLHLVFQHPLQVAKTQHPILYGLAADLTVNQYIPAHQLTQNALTLDKFPNLKLPPNSSTDFYYKKLLEAQHQGIDLLAQLSQDQRFQLQKHQYWQLSANQAVLFRPIIIEQVRTALRQLPASAWDVLPEALRTYVDTTYRSTPSTINWRRRLHLFCSSSKSTILKETIHRPSKRYGSVPGIRIKKRQRFGLAIDTSGSISQSGFQHFFREIHHIWRMGAELLVVECDTKVQRQYAYEGSMPEWVQGRGGTSFTPAIEWLNANGPFDAMIYLTDGQGPSPEVKARCPMLWLITPDGISPQHPNWPTLPGQKIKMRHD